MKLIFEKNIQEYFLNSFPCIIFTLITFTDFPEFDWIVCIPPVSINFVLLIVIPKCHHFIFFVYFLFLLFVIIITKYIDFKFF